MGRSRRVGSSFRAGPSWRRRDPAPGRRNRPVRRRLPRRGARGGKTAVGLHRCRPDGRPLLGLERPRRHPRNPPPAAGRRRRPGPRDRRSRGGSPLPHHRPRADLPADADTGGGARGGQERPVSETFAVEARSRWDAIALLRTLTSYHAWTIQLGETRWLVVGRADTEAEASSAVNAVE